MPSQQTALIRTFFEYRDEIIIFLKRRVQCSATADDLSQDIYLKLQQVEDPAAIENCRNYIFMIAANLVLDRQRREMRRLHLLTDGGLRWGIEADQSPEDILVARAEIDHLNSAVAELSPLTRRIFHASRFENKTQREIAAEFGVSLSTVEYHLRKARDRLASARDAFHRDR